MGLTGILKVIRFQIVVKFQTMEIKPFKFFYEEKKYNFGNHWAASY